MGMFDSVMVDDCEYQTKAFAKCLEKYELGDEVFLPFAKGLKKRFGVSSIQVECLLSHRSSVGSDDSSNYYLVVKDGVLVEVTPIRDSSMPLVSYTGELVD